jgi:hypothetical protein
MSGHTPGPWRMDGTTVYALTDTKEQNRFWCSVQSVRRAEYGEASDAEVFANARLIAAAPDLLEALRWLAGCAGKLGVYPVRDLDEALERARAAIAKAEGTP